MTEAELMACSDSTPMLKFLRGKASERQCRVLIAAFVCRVLYAYEGTPTRRAIQALDDFADGRCSREQLGRLLAKIGRECPAFQAFGFPWTDADLRRSLHDAVRSALHWVLHIFSPTFGLGDVLQEKATNALLRAEEQHLIAIVRDVVGNPFRLSTPLPAAVLAWNDATVRRLAESIYGERAFGKFPVLADGLLDAGCQDEELMRHFRSEGPHAKGCWGVDLVLGRS
jgi:hypothetical protein